MSDGQLQPSRSFSFDLTIKGVSYTADLHAVRLASSIVSPYQVFIFSLLVDANDILLDGLYGQDPCALTINLLHQSGIEGDLIEFDLMIIDMNILLTPKDQISSTTMNERTPLQIITVVRNAFKTMTYPVNKLYVDEGKTVKQVVEDLVSEAGATVDYDSKDENTEPIDQILVPPTTLYKAIQYLDHTFGLFEGVPVYFCDYENKVHVMNLSERITKAQTFTVEQLATDADNTKTFEKSANGDYFYTYDQVSTQYKGNAAYAVLAKSLNHIVHPKDTLFSEIVQDLDTVCAYYGLIAQNQKMQVDSNVADRKTYYINHTGYEETTAFANSMIAKKIASLSTISINIERNLPIWNLINVGEPIKFIPKTSEYIDYGGKYVLKASDFVFIRHGEWQASCTIHLIRTNRII